jgi:hypothetical protein
LTSTRTRYATDAHPNRDHGLPLILADFDFSVPLDRGHFGGRRQHRRGNRCPCVLRDSNRQCREYSPIFLSLLRPVSSSQAIAVQLTLIRLGEYS